MTTSRCRHACLVGVLSLAAVFTLPRGADAQTATQLYSEGVDAYQAGDVTGAQKKLLLALEVDKNFRPATALLAKIAAEKRQGGAQPDVVSAKSLGTIIVPVEFKDTSLQTAIEILRQRIEEQSGGKLKVNFVLKLPPDLANKRITLRLDRVPVTETLRYIGESAGVEFRIEQYAVVVAPAGSRPAAAAPGASPAETP